MGINTLSSMSKDSISPTEGALFFSGVPGFNNVLIVLGTFFLARTHFALLGITIPSAIEAIRLAFVFVVTLAAYIQHTHLFLVTSRFLLSQ